MPRENWLGKAVGALWIKPVELNRCFRVANLPLSMGIVKRIADQLAMRVLQQESEQGAMRSEVSSAGEKGCVERSWSQQLNGGESDLICLGQTCP